MRDASDPRRPRDLRVIPGTGDGGDLVRVFVIARYPSLRAGLRALIEQTLGLIVADITVTIAGTKANCAWRGVSNMRASRAGDDA